MTLAQEMLAECRADGQSVRRVQESARDPLRAELRALARADGMRIRTALLDDTVVVARTDAALWEDDQATMRAKLTPAEG